MIPYTKTQDVEGKMQNNHIVVMKIEIRDPKHVKNDIILDAFEYYPEVLADMGYEHQMDCTII